MLYFTEYFLLIGAYKLGINLFVFHIVKDMFSPILTSVMVLLGKSFLVVLPLLALYLYLKKDPNTYSFIFAAIVLYIISDTIKILVAEPRPCSIQELSWINKVTCESSFSFPSNHASVLTGLPLFLGKYKILRVFYIIWLLLILFGRVYLGQHYFTDVIAGIILSIFVSYIIFMYRKKINKTIDSIVAKTIPFASINRRLHQNNKK